MKKLIFVLALGTLISCQKKEEKDVHIKVTDMYNMEGVDNISCEVYSGGTTARAVTVDGQCHLNYKSNDESSQIHISYDSWSWMLIDGEPHPYVSSNMNIINIAIAEKCQMDLAFSKSSGSTGVLNFSYKLTPMNDAYKHLNELSFDWRDRTPNYNVTTTYDHWTLPRGSYLIEWEAVRSTGTSIGSDTITIYPDVSPTYYMSY